MTRARPIDVITLQQQLKDKQLLEQIGGIAYLSQLAGCRAERGEPFLLPRNRPGKISAAADDPDLHGRRRARFMITRAKWTRCWTRWRRTFCASTNRARRASTATVKELVGKAIRTDRKFFQPAGHVERPRHGLPGSGPDDGRVARPGNDRDRGAAFDGQNVAGDEHRRARRAGAKPAGGRVQPGNERGVAGAAHVVFASRA